MLPNSGDTIRSWILQRFQKTCNSLSSPFAIRIPKFTSFDLWTNYRASLGIVAHWIGPQHIFTEGLLRDLEEWVEIVGDGRIMRSIGAGKTAGDCWGPNE